MSPPRAAKERSATLASAASREIQVLQGRAGLESGHLGLARVSLGKDRVSTFGIIQTTGFSVFWHSTSPQEPSVRRPWRRCFAQPPPHTPVPTG